MAVLAIAVAGAIGAAALGSNDLALALGGLAVGLSTKLGAVGGRPPTGFMPPMMALLLALTLGVNLSGCKTGTIVVHDAGDETSDGGES